MSLKVCIERQRWCNKTKGETRRNKVKICKEKIRKKMRPEMTNANMV